MVMQLIKSNRQKETCPSSVWPEEAKGVFRYPQTFGHKGNNNEFLSYDYIYSDKGHYVIFNDLPANSERD